MAQETLMGERFGPLQGVRILSSGSLIAEPFAAALAAEMGAEVIQIERPRAGDVAWRTFGAMLQPREGMAPVSSIWAQERRNVFCVTLDLRKPRGREIFLKLAARAEIWMENQKAGTYARWGLDDKTVSAVNQRLVITHVSGFGQTGHPDYVGRPSYDFIGQAFGGMMYQTGFPDPTPPTRAAPWVSDYITALFTLWSSLAGLTYARATGKGQSIDLAQYEAVHRLLGGTMIEYFAHNEIRERSGNKTQGFQPGDTFRCRDGWIVIAVLAGESYNRMLTLLDCDPKDQRWQRARTELETPDGIELDRRVREWAASHTVAEAVRLFAEIKVACAPIMNSKDMADDPHYRMRGTHVEWEDEVSGRVKGVGIVPGFSLTPGKIVRGSVPIGHDNERVYCGILDLDREELESLRRDEVI
ncbi:MAG: CaiB/BaiF CoA transferase family protein [Candidatus Binataceae bacterium]